MVSRSNSFDPTGKNNSSILSWWIAALMVILLCLLSTGLLADDGIDDVSRLKITPNKCVSLHKGQVCYQHISFYWQAAVAGDYCLYSQETEAPLQCWYDVDEGEFVYDFQSAQSLTFYLKHADSTTAVAASSVIISWVYQSKKARNWRLF